MSGLCLKSSTMRAPRAARCCVFCLTQASLHAFQGRPADAKDSGRQLTITDTLSLEDRQLVVRRALNTEQQDAQDYLERVRARFDRWAGIETRLGSI